MITHFPRAPRFGLAALALFLTLGGPAAAQYRLAPGDRVKVTVLGAGELSGEVEVDVDGSVRLPMFGAVPASDGDVEALQNALRDAIEGRVFKRLAADGAASFIAVEPDDVYASVVAYRPVYVSGAVNRGGGMVPFRPGMTVRVALASAGGTGEAAIADNPRLNGPRLQGEEKALSYEIGRLIAELWRIEAELVENPYPDDPDRTAVPLHPETFEALLLAERKRLESATATMKERRAFAEEAIAQTTERKRILEAQRANQVTAAEFDAEEQARVEVLTQRGVVPISRLVDTRRAQLLSSTRLLDTENNLERIDLERIRFESDRRLYEEDRRRSLLDAAAQARSRLETASARFAAVREELAVNGQAILDLDVTRRTATVVTVFRGRETLADVDPDLLLEPGDVIEVVVEILDPTAAIQ